MVMINMAGEGGRTPTYHSMGSPRYGGCVSALLHFFDWNPSKRFSTTKRLPANKPEKATQRSRSLRSDHGPAANTRMTYDAQFEAVGSTASAEDYAADIRQNRDASSRAPSLVARLMGLETLPEITQPYEPPQPHRRWSYTGGREFYFEAESDGTPMLLQDLLKRDFKGGRRTLRDRMPGFAKRAQEQYENRFMKKGVEALRCQPEEVIPAYIDIPEVQRHQISGDSKPSFLSRLAPSTSTQQASPLLPSKLHTYCELSPLTVSLETSKNIPELSLHQPAGWPLARQRIHDHDHESCHEISFRSESDRSSEFAYSKPSNGRWTWNGSEGISSTNDLQQVEEPRAVSLPVQNFAHGKPRIRRETSKLKKAQSSSSEQRSLRKSVSSDEASVWEFKTSRTRSPGVSPKVTAAQNLRSGSTGKAILSLKVSGESLIQSRRRSTDCSKSSVPQENSRTISASLESSSTASQASISKSNTTLVPISSKKSNTERPSPTFARTIQTKMKSDAMAVKGMSKALPHSKPPPLDGYRALKVRNIKSRQRDSTPVVSGSRVFPSAGSPSRATLAESGSFPDHGRVLGAQKEGDKLPVVSKKRIGEQEMKTTRQPFLLLSKQSATNTLLGIQRVRDKVLATTMPASLADRLNPGNLEDMAVQNSCGIVSKHARARSIDEVFPELPLDFDNSIAFASSISESDIAMSNEHEVSASLSQSIECMYGQGFAHVDQFTDCEDEARRGTDWFCSSVIGCEEANPLVDGLRWVDEILEQRVSYCERSCSGPSISSVSVDASDAEDESIGDAWSSCASYNPANCDSPRTFEIPDTIADSDLPEQILAAPTFVKRISEESHGATVATEVDEARQPSPVSILHSPFHDEVCTPSEFSLTDSRQQHSSDEDGFKSCTRYKDNKKIHQALLDISMFQSLEAFTFKYNERTPNAGRKEEQSFVQEILSAAQFLSTPGSSPNWFDRDVAIDPSLFDRLELSGNTNHIENGPAGGVQKFRISGGLWRCDRKLLFDCVNEAFSLVLWRYRQPEMGLLQRVSPRPRGQKLVEEVYKKIEEWQKIEEWRKLALHGVDSLIEKDMCINSGSWKDFSAEVAKVGLDIEIMLLEAIVEEAVVDILSPSKHQ